MRAGDEARCRSCEGLAGALEQVFALADPGRVLSAIVLLPEAHQDQRQGCEGDRELEGPDVAKPAGYRQAQANCVKREHPKYEGRRRM